MRFKEMLRYAANVFKKKEVLPGYTATTGTERDLKRKHFDAPRPSRPKGMMKSRHLVSGIPIIMRRIRRPWSDMFIVDTRPREDGHENCAECGHNRFKTKYKTSGGMRVIECRNPACETRRIV